MRGAAAWLGTGLLALSGMLAAEAATPAADGFPEWRFAATDAAAKSALDTRRPDLAGLPGDSLSLLRRTNGKAAGAWRFQLPGGHRIELLDPEVTRHPNGDRTLSGAVRGGGVLHQALFTVGRTASFGSFDTPFGHYRFEAQGDEGWLIALDHPSLRLAPADAHAVGAGVRGDPDKSAAASASSTVIDILFLYSADFEARYPQGAAETRINHLVALSNQLFANSGVDLVLRAVGIDPTAYADGEGGGDNGVALNRMASALAGTTTHPAFGNLRNRRDQLGADLVSLFWPADIETRGSCGIARLFGGGANSGVNVVADGFSSWSLCADDVLAHEVGHNLGAEHQNGANSANAGFGTAHVVPGQYHTLMGSFGSGHPDRGRRLARFSNPQQLCGGRPCGVAGVSDNARRLRDRMAAVAGYRPTALSSPPPAPPAPIDPDSDGDGVPDSADAFPFDARYRSDRDGDGVADEVDAFPDDPAEWLDTDGDGVGNNADPDDDGDGVADAQDAFPLLASEWQDSDGDGVGDNADAFPTDRREWRDTDADGLGDNADPDRDGDGFVDLADVQGTAGQDLLVVSAGSDRLLRYRAEDGLFAGVEAAEQHVPQVFGPQAGLAWNPALKLLYSTNSAALRRYQRDSRERLDTFVAGFRGGPLPGFVSGFPVGLSVADDGTVYALDTDGALQRHEAIRGQPQPGGQFGQNVLQSPARATALAPDGTLWLLERSGRLTAIDRVSGTQQRQLFGLVNGQPALRDPTALLVDADGRRLLVADAMDHRVLRIDPERAGEGEVLIAAGAGGLSVPTGLARLAGGSLVVSSSGNDRLLRYAADGTPLGRFDLGPEGLLRQPRALLAVPRVIDRFPDDPRRALRPVAGGWANPARLGHGLDLQNAGDQLAVIWYTFRNDGRPIWYLALGPLEGAVWDAELLQFRFVDGIASSQPVGRARLDFADERNAVFSWTLPGSEGSEPMRPLDVGPSSETQFPTAAWFDPAEPGWGLSVTRQGGVDYAIAFLYDSAGDPSWLAGAADDPATPQRFAMFRYDGPTRCPGCPGTAEASLSPAGSLRFLAVDGNRAQLESDLAADVLQWRRAPLPFERLTDTPTRPGGDP